MINTIGKCFICGKEIKLTDHCYEDSYKETYYCEECGSEYLTQYEWSKDVFYEVEVLPSERNQYHIKEGENDTSV